MILVFPFLLIFFMVYKIDIHIVDKIRINLEFFRTVRRLRIRGAFFHIKGNTNCLFAVLKDPFAVLRIVVEI